MLSVFCVLPHAAYSDQMCAMVVPELDANCNATDPDLVSEQCLQPYIIRCLKEKMTALKEEFAICLDKGAELLDGACTGFEDGKGKKRRKKKKKKK